jgi:asparagine synthase (glutamine-hydrolysing)
MPRFFLKSALRAAKRLPASNEKIGFDYKLKRFLEGSLMSPEAAHVFWNGTFTEEEKRTLFRFADAAPMESLLGQMRRADTMERFLEFDQRVSLQDALLYKVDRMSMAHSLEVRPPFLDDRIIRFAKRLPVEWKLNGLETKHILRVLMRDSLPQAVLRRPKVGLDIPIHAWFRTVLKPLLRDTLNEEAVRAGGVFHWSAIRSLMEQHEARKANWGYHLWGLLTLTMWMRRWNVVLPTVPEPARYVHEQSLVGGSLSHWQPVSCSVETS